MSKVEIDGVSFDVAPEVAGLLQVVSKERDELLAEARQQPGLPKAFLNELKELINRHSIENVADVPDFILAVMICRFLAAVGPSIKKTLDWHGCNSVCHTSPNATQRRSLPLEAALAELNTRTADREARAVEGTHKE